MDVKTGSGAFMKTIEASRALADSLVRTGRLLGLKVTALITSMVEPLGHAVGNAVEVVESVEVLRGGGPDDVREVSIALAMEMLLMAGRAQTRDEAQNLLNQKIVTGEGLEKFRQIITAQGGNADVVDDDSLLPVASHRCEIKAPRRGFVQSVDARMIGKAAMLLGAGRETVDHKIDPAAAIWVRKKSGDAVSSSEPICTLEFNSDLRLAEAIGLAERAFLIGDERVTSGTRILERIEQK
jgi:thymidine phosphorylase